jgi:penicillin-binding protein 1A
MYRAPRIAPDQLRRRIEPPLIPQPPAPEWEPEEEEYEAPPPKPRRRWGLWLLKWCLLLAIWSAIAVGATIVLFAWDLPRPETALDATRRPSLTLEDRTGQIFATYGDIVGDSLRITDMPAYLPAAAVAVEDRRFYHHFGIDLIGIARAALVNIRAGRLVQGGSTLTQQVAKNLFLTSAKTYRRKVQELLLTLWLEQHFTKQEILEIWLNRVYLGSGAWGADAAARLYFGTSARHITLWQAAVIAGLPRAPSRFSPRVNPEAAAARGREVLAAMADTGAITAELAQAASNQIAFPPRPATAGWFADWAAERAEAILPPDSDAAVRTTLDLRMQAVVEAKITQILDGPGATANVGQAAVIVLDAGTGAIRAMAGGRDYRSSPFNRAVSAKRQPGSAFKPFVWLAALEAGAKPDDTVLDAPIKLGTWSPGNFDGKFRGTITLEEALAHSVNTASVRLLIQAGGPKVVAGVAQKLGITAVLPNNDTLALGTGEVSLIELAGAYSAFFNGGLKVTPRAIEGFRALKPIAPPPATPARVIEPDQAAMMVRMLAAVVARGSGTAAALPGRFVAGKSGTTQDFKDAWFIGGVGGMVIGVWMGNDDNALMKGVTGGSLPARLFHDIAADLVPK